jgi:hypothetical protein
LNVKEQDEFEVLKLGQDLDAKEIELQNALQELGTLKEQHEIMIEESDFKLLKLKETLESLSSKSEELQVLQSQFNVFFYFRDLY